MRTKRIIAVFGPGDADEPTKDCAKEFGRIIAVRNILLTGGTHCARDSVKNMAICGAGDSPWIGVAREATESKTLGRGFVVPSNLGHRRNYLEALLCDAAIALHPGPERASSTGTRSEATCTLSLHKPVAFVGTGWLKDTDVASDRSDRSEVLASMVNNALALFSETSVPDDLKSQLSFTTLHGGLLTLPRSHYRYFDPEVETAADVVEWIEGVVPDVKGFPDAFPDIKGHESSAADYKPWLRDTADALQ